MVSFIAEKIDMRHMALHVFSFLWIFNTHAQDIVYEGTLYDSNGTPIAESNVDLTLSVLNDTGTCILLEEAFTKLDLSSSKGHFSVHLGTGVRTARDSGHTVSTILENQAATLNCRTSLGAASTVLLDGSFKTRKIQLTVNVVDGVDINDIKLPMQSVGQSVYAMESINTKKIQGIPIDTTTPTNGQVLSYNQGLNRYVPSDVASGGGGSPSDIDTSGASNGDVLTYNSSTSSFEPQSVAASSVDWSNITNRPFGLDDGDQDTVSVESWSTLFGIPAPIQQIEGLSCANGDVLRLSGGSWTCGNSSSANSNSTLVTRDATGDIYANRLHTATGSTTAAASNVLIEVGGDGFIIKQTPSQFVSNLANDTVSGNQVDGGTISNFASTGIDDNASSTAMTIDGSGNIGVSSTGPRALLDINGTVVGKAATVNASTTIDFSSGNMQYTNSNCAAFALHNLTDGGAYTFAIKGTTASTCSFSAFSDAGTSGLTVHMPVGHGATTAGTHTMYNFMVLGGDVYVAWVPGY